MLRKKYEVRGMMEWHPVFKVGRTRLQVSFTGGCLCSGGSTPAYYETEDPVVQAVIEGSALFRSGRVRLASSVNVPGSAPAAKDTEKAKDVPAFVFEYEDIEDVYEFLNLKKGVPIAKLSDNDSCFKEAKKLGITLKQKGRPV
ncbi:MAG: hypothetical protein K2K23_08890 [Muribaculaceae bacterium]|nr:hypothetical protein [Muribaculaceae bacterium]